MSRSTSIRVGCLGAGYFSQFHFESWSRLAEVDLVGVADVDLSQAQATGRPAYLSLSKMLEVTQPDLVDLIVPPPAHAEAIRTALAHGVKWIICQKPFCRSLAEAQAIAAEAETQNAHLIVHENFRFQPWYRAIKQALESDTIGKVLQATFRLRPGDGQGPRAYLDRQPYFQTMKRFLVHETAVHWIDTFRYLFGDPVAVYADLRRENPAISGEDAGFILFDHASGVRSVFDGNRHLDHASDNLRRTMGEALIEGTEGSLSLGGDGALDIRSFGCQNPQRLLEANTSTTFGGDCVHALQRHVVAAIREGTPLENTASDYLRVLHIEDMIYQSAKLGTKLSL